MRKLSRIALALLLGATAACEDISAPAADVPPADVPAPQALPALSALEAARVAVVVEDALGRLVPEADAGALDARLRELAAMLATGDATALGRQIEQTMRAIDGQSMAGADVDALRLALALVADLADAGSPWS